jgi:hypothetical protein
MERTNAPDTPSLATCSVGLFMLFGSTWQSGLSFVLSEQSHAVRFVGAITLGARQEREDAGVLQVVVVGDGPLVAVDRIGVRHRRRRDGVARDRVFPGTLLDRSIMSGSSGFTFLAGSPRMTSQVEKPLASIGALQFRSVLETLLQVGLVTRDVLPRHTDDTGEEDQAGVANARVVVLRIEVREDRVRNDVTVAIRIEALEKACTYRSVG